VTVAAVQMAPLWFGVLGGVAAWTAHLLGSDLVIGVLCSGSGPANADMATVRLALILVTLATALIALAAAIVALRLMSRGQPWQRFLARFGFLLDGLSLGTIALGGLLPAFLRPCA
jgi:hypothetical protein